MQIDVELIFAGLTAGAVVATLYVGIKLAALVTTLIPYI